MTIVQSISFPEDLFNKLKQQVEQVPGGKLSPFVVHLIEKGLDAKENDQKKSTIAQSAKAV